MVRNRSEKFRDIVLVTTRNERRCTLSVPPRLFASHLSPRDRMHSSSQKIFPTVPLCSPALLTQPQRRNTDVRGRSYHVLKLSTPRQKPDSAGFGDTPRFGGVGRKWATHSVCNLPRRISDFPFFSSRKVRPRRAKEPGPAGPASRREVSLLFEYQSHTSGRITLARPAVALWRSGRGALRRQRGRGFESGCGGCGESGSAALERNSVEDRVQWHERMYRQCDSRRQSSEHGRRWSSAIGVGIFLSHTTFSVAFRKGPPSLTYFPFLAPTFSAYLPSYLR